LRRASLVLKSQSMLAAAPFLVAEFSKMRHRPSCGASVEAIAIVDGAFAEATGATVQTFTAIVVRRAQLAQGKAGVLTRPRAAHLATRLPLGAGVLVARRAVMPNFVVCPGGSNAT
jgi:hypothetical protein